MKTKVVERLEELLESVAVAEKGLVTKAMKIGDAVSDGDTLALLHLNTDSPDVDWPEELLAIYSFDDNPPAIGNMIIGKVPAV